MFCRTALLTVTVLLAAASAYGQMHPADTSQPANLVFQGRVVGSDGTPVKEATVRYMSGGPTKEIKTNEKGEFSLTLPHAEFQEWQAVWIEARSADRPGQLGIWANKLQSEDDLKGDIVLRKTTTLAGKVVDLDEKPIANAKVSLLVWASNSGTSCVSTTTDDKGLYSFKDIVPEIGYSVSTSADGYGQASSPQITLEEAKPFEVDDLTLEIADMSLEGIVVDENGKPMEGIRVGCNGRGSVHQDIQTGHDGRFRFEKLVDEPLQLWAYSQGQGPALRGNARAQAGDTDVEIVMSEGSRRPSRSEPAEERWIDKEAPELDAAKWLVGPAATLAGLRGKPLLLVFLKDDAASYADAANAVKDIADGSNNVILVASDKADAALLKQTFAMKKAPWRLALDKAGSDGSDGASFERYKLRKAPGAFLIDPDGKVQYQNLPLAAIAPAWIEMTKPK